jgi:hypothetical protein
VISATQNENACSYDDESLYHGDKDAGFRGSWCPLGALARRICFYSGIMLCLLLQVGCRKNLSSTIKLHLSDPMAIVLQDAIRSDTLETLAMFPSVQTPEELQYSMILSARKSSIRFPPQKKVEQA